MSAADRKKMADAAGKIRKTTGADACARMGIMYIESAGNDSYERLSATYDAYRKRGP